MTKTRGLAMSNEVFRMLGTRASRSSVAWLLTGSCLVASGCMPESREVERSGGPEEAQPVTSAGAAVRRIPRPASSSVRIQETAAGYEVEVITPEGFFPRGQEPLLAIGEAEFTSYRPSPRAGNYGLIFALSKAEFESLRDGDSIGIRYFAGPASPGARAGRINVVGVVDKSAVEH